MSVIIVNFLTFIDRDEYDTYAKKAGPIFMREGVKLIVNDEAPQPLTPELQMDKVVVMEFRDEAHMEAFFKLPDYREAQIHRDKGVKIMPVKTKRFEMPG